MKCHLIFGHTLAANVSILGGPCDFPYSHKLCARWREIRTHQAELVGIKYKMEFPPARPDRKSKLPEAMNHSMTRETLVIWNPDYRRHGSNHKKSRPCFVTKSVRFGCTELLFFPCSKSRDLQSEHGFRACSFQNIMKKLDVRTLKRNSGTKSVEFWSLEL